MTQTRANTVFYAHAPSSQIKGAYTRPENQGGFERIEQRLRQSGITLAEVSEESWQEGTNSMFDSIRAAIRASALTVLEASEASVRVDAIATSAEHLGANILVIYREGSDPSIFQGLVGSDRDPQTPRFGSLSSAKYKNARQAAGLILAALASQSQEA